MDRGSLSRIIAELPFRANNTCEKTFDKSVIGTVWPTHNAPYIVGWEEQPEWADRTPEGFLEGRVLLITQGCFLYETFAEPHKTKFCFILAPTAEQHPITDWLWSVCPGENLNAAD